MFYTLNEMRDLFAQKSMSIEVSNNGIDFIKEDKTYVFILTRDLPNTLEMLEELVNQRFIGAVEYVSSQQLNKE